MIVAATKVQSAKHTRAYKSRTPSPSATPMPTAPAMPGQRKFRRKLSADVFLHARSGPTPVKNNSKRPSGILTLLKNGAPTLILALQVIAVLEIRAEAHRENRDQKSDKPAANVRLRKCMHGTHDTAARQHGSEEAKEEREEDEPHVPH